MHYMPEALCLTSQHCKNKNKNKDYQEARVVRSQSEAGKEWASRSQHVSSDKEGSCGLFGKEGALLTCFAKIILAAVLRLHHRAQARRAAGTPLVTLLDPQWEQQEREEGGSV